MNKSVNNQLDMIQAEYIILTIGYNDKIIIPFVEGLEMLRLLSMSLKIKEEGYGDNRKVTVMKMSDDLSVKFLTEQRYKEMLLEEVLDGVDS